MDSGSAGALESVLTALHAFAENCQLMANLAGVEAQLRVWAESGDAIAGGDAANALDQLRGHLERLPAQAVELLPIVEAQLSRLPAAWE